MMHKLFFTHSLGLRSIIIIVSISLFGAVSIGFRSPLSDFNLVLTLQLSFPFLRSPAHMYPLLPFKNDIMFESVAYRSMQTFGLNTLISTFWRMSVLSNTLMLPTKI